MTITAQPTLDELLFPEPEHAPRYLGRCPVTGCKSRPANRHNRYDNTHRCPSHGRAYVWHEIAGTYSHTRRCDDRCIYARGPDCECSCSGANHGRGW
jgi:hypothetical protein